MQGNWNKVVRFRTIIVIRLRIALREDFSEKQQQKNPRNSLIRPLNDNLKAPYYTKLALPKLSNNNLCLFVTKFSRNENENEKSNLYFLHSS